MALTSRNSAERPSRAPLGATEPLPRSIQGEPSGEVPDHRAQRVDVLLDAMVKREDIPARMPWRVFAASVEHLPGRTTRFVAWRRMAESRVHTSVWGQVAMAASVALTFVAAAWFIVLPGTHPDDGFVQRGSPMIDAVAEPATYKAEPFKWWLIDSGLEYMEAYETTLPELAGDVELLREDLGL